MGVDIHMYLIDKKGKILMNPDDLFEGRNSEWFDNLQGRGWADEYDHLLTHWGVPDFATGEIKEDFDNSQADPSYGFYNFSWINAIDYINWFNKYRPDLKAGWASTYDKWRIQEKEYTPDELPRNFDDEYMNTVDWEFIEYQDKHNCDMEIVKKISNAMKFKFFKKKTFYLVFYFDC